MKALFQNGLYRVHYIVSSQCWKKWQLLKELQFSKKLQCLKGWHSSKRCSVQGEEAISGVGGGVQGEEAISLFIHTFTQYCCLYLLNSKRSQWKLSMLNSGPEWKELIYFLSVGFLDMRRDVQEIFRMTPHEKQVMMFSATLSKEIRPVCRKFMQDVITPPLALPRQPLLPLATDPALALLNGWS